MTIEREGERGRERDREEGSKEEKYFGMAC